MVQFDFGVVLARDGRRFEIEFEPATNGNIDKVTANKGTMAVLLAKASTTPGGERVVTIELRFLFGDEYVSESFLESRPAQVCIEVDVRGTPGCRVFHEVYMERDIIGTWSSGTRGINATLGIVAAGPGVLSPLDLPLPHTIQLQGELTFTRIKLWN